MNLKPKYATSADACYLLIGGISAYTQPTFDARMKACELSFDSQIDKAGGGDPSEGAQHDIKEICDNSCVYQATMPLVRDWMSYDPNCYPRCIFGLNVAAGKIKQNPDLPAEVVVKIKSMSPAQRKKLVKSFDDSTGMKIERIPLQNLTPEERQDLRGMFETYKPYSPFYTDDKAMRSKLVMWLIVLLTVGVIIYLSMKSK